MKRYLLATVLAIALLGCANHGDKYGNNQTPNTDGINVPMQSPGMSYDGANSDGNATQGAPLPATPTIQGKPSLIKMYVENSGSIFGYVKGTTEYVDALTDIAQLPVFVTQKIPVDISFVNGANPIVITHIGNSFNGKLNQNGMKCGNTRLSDLNTMFDTILSNTGDGTITILVSDGIYDIGTSDLSALTIKGKATRTAFLNRLNDSTANLQTLLVKMTSEFDGTYYYATKNGSLNIKQQRPYYIWIIGDSNMISTYFSDATLKGLNGYQNHVRYVKVGNNKLPFEIDLSTSTALLRLDHHDTHALTKHKAIHGQFELATIVDYDGLHYSDAYLMDSDNYQCNLNFTVTSISKASATQAKSAGVGSYKRPFMIKLTTSQPNPMGKLTIQLKNTQPSWIDASNAQNENVIDNNTTYGFSTLTKSIREAYEYVSDSIPAVFEIIFKN